MKIELKPCPVCGKKGVVPVKHPPDTPEWVKETKFAREPCEFCNGNGVVTKEKLRKLK